MRANLVILALCGATAPVAADSKTWTPAQKALAAMVLAGAGPKVLAEIAKANGEMGEKLMPGTRFSHRGDCFGADRSLVSHNHVYFDGLCFAHGTTNVASIQFSAG